MNYNFKNILTFIQEDSEIEILNENKQPLIGVFWLFNENIIGDVRDPNSSEDTVSQIIDGNKIVNGKFNHWSIWNKIKPNELKDKDYLFLPRGRIISDDTNYKFIIFANKILDSMGYRTKIKQYYNLSEKDIIWNFNDSHYN